MKLLECFPYTIDDMILNRTHAENIYNMMKTKDMNILLTGVNGSGKKTMIQCVMNSLFPKDLISNAEVKTTEINDDNLIYKHSNNYFEINCHTIKQQSKNSIVLLLKDICSNYSLNIDTLQLNKMYIIVQNIDSLNKSVQFSIRRIIEKYCDTSVFLFTSSKINNIDDSIKSRFFCYRLPLKKEDIADLMKQKLNISKKIKQSNILDTFLDIEKNKSKIHDCYINIIAFIRGTKSLSKMKESLHELLSYNIDYTQIIKNIIKKLNVKDHLKSMNIWEVSSHVNYMCLTSSKILICLEYFIVKVKTCI